MDGSETEGESCSVDKWHSNQTRTETTVRAKSTHYILVVV